MNIDVIEKHNNTIPAAMIIGLTDRALRDELWHLSFDLIKESHNRTFGRWLLGLCCDEMQRRSGDGELEPASCEIPFLEPGELASALLLTNLYTYSQVCESLAKLFDHCHVIFIYQSREFLRAIK